MLPFTGFALAALLTYKNLEVSVNRSFEGLKGHNSTEDDVAPSFKIFSKVVSVVVSNPSTQQLDRPVTITLRHLEVAPCIRRQNSLALRWTCCLSSCLVLCIRTQKRPLRWNTSVRTGMTAGPGPQRVVMHSCPTSHILCVHANI